MVAPPPSFLYRIGYLFMVTPPYWSRWIWNIKTVRQAVSVHSWANFFVRGSVLKLIVRQLFQLPLCRGVSKIDELVMCMVSINCSRRLIVLTVRILSLTEVITYFVSIFLFLCLSLILQSLLSFRQPAYTSIDFVCSGTHHCCEYTQMKFDTRIKKILEEFPCE